MPGDKTVAVRLVATNDLFKKAMGEASASVEGLASSVESHMKGISTSASTELGKADSSASKWGSTLMATGAGAAVLGAGIVVALAKAGQAYGAQETAELKLQNTMRNEPQLANANVAAFHAQALALQAHTEASYNDVTSTQAMLGQFGLTQSQIEQVTPLVVDLSEKMGVSLEAASKAVGKSLDGTTAGLKRYGILVDDNGMKTQAYGATVQALSATVGGFAQAQGATFEGRLTEIKNQLTYLEAGVGKEALQAFQNMLGPVEHLSTDFAGLSQGTQSTVGEIAAFAGAGLIAAGAASSMIGFVVKMSTNFGVARDAVSGYVSELTLADAAQMAATAAMAAGVGGTLYAISQWNDATKKLQDQYTKPINFDNYAQAAVGINKLASETQDLGNQWNRMSDLEKLAHPEVWEEYSSLAAQYDQDLKQIGVERQKIEDIGKALGISGSAAQNLVQQMNVDPATANWSKLEPVLLNLATGSMTAAQAQAAYKAALDGSSASANTQAAQASADQTTIENTTKDYQSATSALQGLLDQTKTYLDTLSGSLDTQGAYEQDVRDLTSAFKTNGATLDINTDAGYTNLQAVEKVRDGIIDMGTQYIKTGGSVSSATSQTELYVDGLYKQMTQSGISQKAALDYINQLGLTPANIATAFNQPGLATAQQNASSLQNQYYALGQPVTTTVTLNTTDANQAIDQLLQGLAYVNAAAAGKPFVYNPAQAGGGTGGHAAGGPMGPGQSSPVAERGPEVFESNGKQYLLTGAQGGRIMTTSELAGRSQPVGGNGGINLTIPYQPGVEGGNYAAFQAFVRSKVMPEVTKAVRSGQGQRG